LTFNRRSNIKLLIKMIFQTIIIVIGTSLHWKKIRVLY